MSVAEIEKEIVKLSQEELAQIAAWINEYMSDEWDKQMEADAAAGKFDVFEKMIDEARAKGELLPMPHESRSKPTS